MLHPVFLIQKQATLPRLHNRNSNDWLKQCRNVMLTASSNMARTTSILESNHDA